MRMLVLATSGIVGDVHSENLSIGCDPSGQFDRRLTRSAAQIDDSLAPSQVAAVDGETW